MRIREVDAGGWEGWLTVYPDALKKASDRVRAHRLMKRLAMANVKDGEFQAKLGCRRSGRLSSPAIFATAALGMGRSADLKPIEEVLESDSVDLKMAQSAKDSDVIRDLMRAPSALGDGSDDSCPESVPLMPFTEEALDEAGALGGVGVSEAAISAQIPGAVFGDSQDSQVILPRTEEALAEVGDRGGDGVSVADIVAQFPGDVHGDSQVRLSYSQVESAALEDNPTVLATSVMDTEVVLGGEFGQGGGEVAASSLIAVTGWDMMVMGVRTCFQGGAGRGILLMIGTEDRLGALLAREWGVLMP
ncbi:hypothetical protein Dimus_036752 [Dionaea muscipula]